MSQSSALSKGGMNIQPVGNRGRTSHTVRRSGQATEVPILHGRVRASTHLSPLPVESHWQAKQILRQHWLLVLEETAARAWQAIGRRGTTTAASMSRSQRRGATHDACQPSHLCIECCHISVYIVVRLRRCVVRRCKFTGPATCRWAWCWR